MEQFTIDPDKVFIRLKKFISATVGSKGFNKVVLGLSGGLDSTVTAYLSARSLGSENVIGVIMPYGRLSDEASRDAYKVAKILNIKTKQVDIAPMINAYFRNIKDAGNLRRGNKMARERMSILYDFSQMHNALVIGTSNKTEILLGYGTVYGDCACALNPIGSLYKTHLRELAGHIGVPSAIIKKPPTAGLWPGQEDEEELGYKYCDIDRLLYFMVDKKLNNKKLQEKGFEKSFIEDIRRRIRANRFKSQLPVIAKL